MPEIPWFGDNLIGSEVSFTKSNPSIWRLERKISENTEQETEEYVKEMEMASEARAIFFCSRVDGLAHQEAVIKIRMQVPNIDTETRGTRERAMQAHTIPDTGTQNEIKALQILTQAACSSSPTLLAWKQEKQSADMWVPDGYIVYILMNKLPGICIENVEFLPPQERNELRESFKDAWHECRACGVVNRDACLQNILWDRETKKCYIVDFEMSCCAEDSAPWSDNLFRMWHLLVTPGCDIYEL